MIEERFTIRNPKGIHGRVAKEIAGIIIRNEVRCGMDFQGETADASSILEILSLAVTCGSDFVMRIEGDRAQQAAAALSRLFDRQDDP